MDPPGLLGGADPDGTQCWQSRTTIDILSLAFHGQAWTQELHLCWVVSLHSRLAMRLFILKLLALYL